jgi:hypothetical protein
MIEKSNSTSLALATIAILGQPPSGDQAPGKHSQHRLNLTPEQALRTQRRQQLHRHQLTYHNLTS